MIMIKQPRTEVATDCVVPEKEPFLFAGQIVRHRRYGYRGVIVRVDPVCKADDDWYQSNQTQPDRDQPWYHVLVDGSCNTTYAAQSSLVPDDAPAPIKHPYLELFFSDFAGDHYVRNDRRFPSWDDEGA